MVEQALNALNQRDIEVANLHATPIGYLGVGMVASQGVKNAEPDWFNPYAGILYAQEAREIVNPESAQIFLELMERKMVPSWAMQQADMKLIKAAAR